MAPVSLVLGSNNAGKSTVLEAAALLMRPLEPTQWVQVARQRDVDAPLVDGLWSLFPSGAPLQVDDGPKQTRPLVLSGDVANEERRLAATALASLPWDAETSGDLTLRVEARVNKLRPHTLEFRRDSFAQSGEGVTSYRCFAVTPSTHRSTRNLVEHLSKVIDIGEKPLAVELMRLFDPEVLELDISAIMGRENIKVAHKDRGIVDLASFGDGMRRAAALALALIRAKGGLLLVDELEVGFHTSVLASIFSRLFLAAQTTDVQIIATTHSLEAIDAVIEALTPQPESLAAYYLQRKENQTVAHYYDTERLVRLRETGLDLR
jgi:predicted ATPase